MNKTKEQKTATVVGAGVGGVATAARLANAAFKVTSLRRTTSQAADVH
jgi:phytoene dehydrogenase-like protein